jgi:phosphatidate cytidylyltransferase
MLKHRLFFGALMIAALVGLIWLDDYLAESLAPDLTPSLLVNLNAFAQDGGIVFVVMLVLVLLGVRELHRLFVAAGSAPLKVWPGVICAGLVAIPFLVKHGLTSQISQDLETDYEVTAGWLVIGLVGTFVLVMFRRQTQGSTAAIATTLFMICYVGLLAQFMMRIRMRAPSGAAWLLLYYVATVKICDIGAYFTGYKFGQHKLIEWLSPKKTVEGLVGGIAASTLFAIVVAVAVQKWGAFRLQGTFPDVGTAAVFGVVMAVVGQTGDLVESLLKRDAQMKDSASVIPAFGGVLDILDSLLLTAPFAFWILLESN